MSDNFTIAETRIQLPDGKDFSSGQLSSIPKWKLDVWFPNILIYEARTENGELIFTSGIAPTAYYARQLAFGFFAIALTLMGLFQLLLGADWGSLWAIGILGLGLILIFVGNELLLRFCHRQALPVFCHELGLIPPSAA